MRGFQSPTRQNNYGFFDFVGNRYDDPRYPLDLKVGEWRDGQLKYWITDNPGAFFAISIAISPVFFGLFCLFWYTFHDTETWFV